MKIKVDSIENSDGNLKKFQKCISVVFQSFLQKVCVTENIPELAGHLVWNLVALSLTPTKVSNIHVPKTRKYRFYRV